jgi:cytochrome c-type protein NapC
MDLSEQEKLSRKKHKRAEEEGKTCIECHKGVAHEEPYEPYD